MGYVYKITNLTNNKIYIGQTSATVNIRFKEHCGYARRRVNRPLYNAINKYGLENFTIEPIEEIDDSELQTREIYWIDYYNSYKYGYNLTLGGEGVKKYNYDEILEYLIKDPCVSRIAEIFGCSKYTVYKISKMNNVSLIHRNSKILLRYDLDGNYIDSFKTALDASKTLGSTNKRRHILEAATNKRKTAYGYIWRLQNGLVSETRQKQD